GMTREDTAWLELEVEAHFHDIRRAVAMRSYDQGQEYAERAFTALGIGKMTSIGQARVAGATWASDERRQAGLGRLVVRVVRHVMHLNVLTAQAEFLAEGMTEGPHPGQAEYLERAVMCYHFGQEVMRHLPEERDGFMQLEGAYLRTLLGLSLANVGRHVEAQRRFI